MGFYPDWLVDSTQAAKASGEEFIVGEVPLKVQTHQMLEDSYS